MRTLFYRLPRLSILAILVILAGAIGSLLTLGRQEDPTLVERFGYVLTTLPGADAERIEATITDPIESAIRLNRGKEATDGSALSVPVCIRAICTAAGPLSRAAMTSSGIAQTTDSNAMSGMVFQRTRQASPRAIFNTSRTASSRMPGR